MKDDNIVSEEYSKAVVEVLNILERLPSNEVDKIPKKLLEFFKKVALEDYKPQLDFSKNLNEIELMEKTKDILAMLYRNYWCSEEERKEYDILLNENEKKYREELEEKYSVENLLKKYSYSKQENTNNYVPLVIEKEKFYIKVLNFIKKLLGK